MTLRRNIRAILPIRGVILSIGLGPHPTAPSAGIGAWALKHGAFRSTTVLFKVAPPPPPTCLRTPSPHPMSQCGFTQDKLIDLKKDIKKGSLDYVDYFIKSAHTLPNGEQVDIDRCKKCGCCIDEHAATPSVRTPMFDCSSPWPTAHAPPTAPTGAVPATELSFLRTTGGPWCFEPDVSERIVRNREYPLLWKRLQAIRKTTGRKGLLIMGHPGIGKTLLLDILLSWNLHTDPKQPVIVVGADKVTVFTNVDGNTPMRYTEDRKEIFDSKFPNHLINDLKVVRGADILVLHDVKTGQSLSYQTGLLENLIQTFNITCVLASSPKESNYKDFEKAFHPSRFVLPTLSFAEAKMAVQHNDKNVSDVMVLEWYRQVGGVLRHLQTKSDVAKAVSDQKRNVYGLHFNPGFYPTHATVEEDTNKLVQPIPLEDRTNVDVYDFVSENARQIWFEYQDASNVVKQLTRLERATGSTRPVLGHFFEVYVISLLKSDFRFSRRKLDGGMLEPWEIRTAQKFTVARYPGDDATSVVPTGVDTLYLPQSSQFPVVDAIIVSATGVATLIQVTVGNDHKPKASSVKDLFGKLAKNKLKIESFVWVVDTSSELNTKQATIDGTVAKYNKLDQYLCRIGARMCWVMKKKSDKSTAVCFPISSSETADDILEHVKKEVDPKATKMSTFKSVDGTQNKPYIFE